MEALLLETVLNSGPKTQEKIISTPKNVHAYIDARLEEYDAALLQYIVLGNRKED
jgi:DNA-binding phage protein